MTQELKKLTEQASRLGQGQIEMTAAETEVSRILQICNACRYCEGFCAVFPAMTRRLEFKSADVNYLANLCHQCSACLYACQYAPPHEFSVNVPQALAKVRKETYIHYAWPKPLGKLYQRNATLISLLSAITITLFLLGCLNFYSSNMGQGWAGNFYAIYPHNTLALLFGAVFGYSILALFMGVKRFWKEAAPGLISSGAISEAAYDSLSLKYLGGGHGDGCNNEDDEFSLWRKYFHHFTFYGFMLCLGSTSVATIYHYFFNLEAPYPLLSLPVILGTLGGIGLIIGPIGLLVLNLKKNPLQADVSQDAMSRAFILLLALISITGLGLLIERDGELMPIWLSIHLGFVMTFFLTMPYGKFAHGIYRVAALLKNAIEKRHTSRISVGSD